MGNSILMLMKEDRGPGKHPAIFMIGHVPAILHSVSARTERLPPSHGAACVVFDTDYLRDADNEAEKPPEAPRKKTTNPFLKRST